MRDTSARTTEEAQASLASLSRAISDYQSAQRLIVRAPVHNVVSLSEFRQRRQEARRTRAAEIGGEI